jgi:hypothetical protein
MDREFLKSAHFTKANLLQNVLAPHGFDGDRADYDIQRVSQEEKTRHIA